MKFKELLSRGRQQTTTAATSTDPAIRVADEAPQLENLTPQVFDLGLPSRPPSPEETVLARPRTATPEPDERTMVDVQFATDRPTVVRSNERPIPDSVFLPPVEASTQFPPPFELQELPIELRRQVMGEVVFNAMKPGSPQERRDEAVAMTSLNKATSEAFLPLLQELRVQEIIAHGTQAIEVKRLVGAAPPVVQFPPIHEYDTPPRPPGPLRLLEPVKQEAAIIALMHRFNEPGIDPGESRAAMEHLDSLITNLSVDPSVRILCEALRSPPPVPCARFDVLFGQSHVLGRGTVFGLPQRNRIEPLMVAIEGVFGPDVVQNPVTAERQKRVREAVAELREYLRGPLEERIAELTQ